VNVLLVTTDQQKATTIGAWLREPDPDAVATPPLFMAFDVLYHDRRDLTGRPLREPPASLAACARCQEAYAEARKVIEDAGGIAK
jgi:ATP-dependent DNA ligase